MAEILDQDQLEKDAKVAYQGEKYVKAAALFNAARESRRSRGDSLKAAELANNVSVSFLLAGEAEQAFRILEGVDDIFDTAGNTRGLAFTLGNRAAALETLGKKEEALNTYQKSADQFKQIGDQENYAATMQSLSALQLRSGRSLEALTTMQAGINLVERPNFKQRLLKRLLDIPFRLLNR
jgi:tetratricopeptide (TPR) repeat protein